MLSIFARHNWRMLDTTGVSSKLLNTLEWLSKHSLTIFDLCWVLNQVSDQYNVDFETDHPKSMYMMHRTMFDWVSHLRLTVTAILVPLGLDASSLMQKHDKPYNNLSTNQKKVPREERLVLQFGFDVFPFRNNLRSFWDISKSCFQSTWTDVHTKIGNRNGLHLT